MGISMMDAALRESCQAGPPRCDYIPGPLPESPDAAEGNNRNYYYVTLPTSGVCRMPRTYVQSQRIQNEH